MTKARKIAAWIILLLPIILFFLSLNIGAYSIPIGDVFRTLASPLLPNLKAADSTYQDILFHIRLPRLLLALVVGAGLSVSGASLQALFKNPLVNEYILGISSGAAFGAALSVVFLGRMFPPQPAAFLFALVAVLAVLGISGKIETSIVTLILTGVIVSAFFTALLSLVEFFASPYALQSIFFWLMGNLSLAGWPELAYSVPLILAGTTVMILMRWRMNVLSMSTEEARALGVNIKGEKLIVILTATLTTAAATSVAGVIGWIGLIVPHLVRMLTGADNRYVIPVSASLGASFLVLADDITRSLTSYEIPIGIFTSLIGIPLFIILLKKSGRIWL